MLNNNELDKLVDTIIDNCTITASNGTQFQFEINDVKGLIDWSNTKMLLIKFSDIEAVQFPNTVDRTQRIENQLQKFREATLDKYYKLITDDTGAGSKETND